MSRTPHFLENDAAPREWSVCSWERTMAASDAGSTPADSSRSAMSRAPRPASIRIRVSPDSTTVVLPELPEPRTRKRTARMLSEEGDTARPSRGRLEKGGPMLEALVLSVALGGGAAAPAPHRDHDA